MQTRKQAKGKTQMQAFRLGGLGGHTPEHAPSIFPRIQRCLKKKEDKKKEEIKVSRKVMTYNILSFVKILCRRRRLTKCY